MRALLFTLLLAIPAAAHAEPAQEARSATAACLSAVIDGAPVADIDGDDVTIRRGKAPVSCTVRVTAGEPVVIHEAVMSSITKRPELFTAARTHWEAGDYASRETFCNIPGRRALAVFVSTAKPGRQPVLTATVFEDPKRDPRCDKDLGVQSVAAAQAPEAAAPAPAEIAPAPAPKKKRSLLGHIPGLRR
jgi:hypothetical protein